MEAVAELMANASDPAAGDADQPAEKRTRRGRKATGEATAESQPAEAPAGQTKPKKKGKRAQE
jgi:hypothetical protein